LGRVALVILGAWCEIGHRWDYLQTREGHSWLRRFEATHPAEKLVAQLLGAAVAGQASSTAAST